MSGVEILAVKEVAANSTFNNEAFLIAFFISSIIVFIMCLAIGISEADPEFIIIGIFFSVIFGVLFGILAGNARAEPAEYRNEYKVIVSDKVSMNDFFERYEIIDCEGSIYTVIEK